MKKLMLLLGLCLFTSIGCIQNDDTTKVVRTAKSENFYVIEFEGCEYIVYDGYQEGAICHKGNCKFCGVKE
jgi:hypothetical protein